MGWQAQPLPTQVPAMTTEIRAAATLLREYASLCDDATNWARSYGDSRSVCLAAGRDDANLIALLGPKAAVALAGALEFAAGYGEDLEHPSIARMFLAPSLETAREITAAAKELR